VQRSNLRILRSTITEEVQQPESECIPKLVVAISPEKESVTVNLPGESSIQADVRGGSSLHLTLRKADLKEEKRELDPGKVALVIVDMWAYHWCKTAQARTQALVPRIVAAMR